MKPLRRCYIFLVDGSRPDVFRRLCEAGELPHCEEVFKREGRFGEAVSTFPSTTGPAYLPFLTGCYPGTCNVPGIRWFDKKVYGEGGPRFKRYRSYVGFESFFLNHDITLQTPTLFEYFKHPVNIFSAVNRGTTFRANKSKHSRIWYWYYAHLTDRWSMVDEAATAKFLKAIDEGADFTFVVYPAIDEFSHLAHPFHPKTLQAYRKIDEAVGKVVQRLKQKGWWEESLVVLVSDHGLSATEEHFGLASFLEDRGIKTFYYPKIFKWNFEAASMVSGNGMLHLYFREKNPSHFGNGWHGRTPFELLEEERGDLLAELLAQPAVDILAGQAADGSILALSKRGRARIRAENGSIRYSVLDSDPFGYPALPPLMSRRESLEQTAATEYPDAPEQLLQIFRSSRTGDWVLSATKGFDLRKRFEHPEHRSSHGGLIREHMAIPFFCNVPLPSTPARSSDVFPTLLKLMGKEIPEGIDGVSLI